MDQLREVVEAFHAWYRDNRGWWEAIKSSGGYRAYYDRQYASRLAS